MPTHKDPSQQSKPLLAVSDYLKTLPVYPLPHHFLSSLMHAFMRIRIPAVKNAQIRTLSRMYNINLAEAQSEQLADYPTFNAFFTRALKESARPLDTSDNSIVSPADGKVSQLGDIRSGSIIQAKGHEYDIYELLGGDKHRARPFENGHFVTIYLSPRDYHRVHMPIKGTLREMIHVPGRLFSVGEHTVRRVPRLFARNERVVCMFDTEIGPVAHILVGAIFVSSMETTWAGAITPPGGRFIHTRRYPTKEEKAIEIGKGMEMGRFNMGSTTITLFPKDTIEFEHTLVSGSAVQMGQRIAHITE